MVKKFAGLVLALSLVAGCSKAADSPGMAKAPTATLDIKEEKAKASGQISVTLPRIAYTYGLAFRLPARDIAGVLQRHADLCAKAGPQECQIISMRQDTSTGSGGGELHLAVAAARARAFSADLSRLTDEAGGQQVSSTVSGDDLSKKIIDTDARIKARTVMRDRLMQVLATRQGKVSELVEAEKAVADANEDIDAARSELADMQGRVNYSQITVTYSDGSTGGFLSPVGDALRDIGGLIGQTVALLIRFLAVLFPVGLLTWGAGWLLRKRRRFVLDKLADDGGDQP